MRNILLIILLTISCATHAQDSLILKTGTDGYVTLIMGSVSANYQRGYLGTSYNYQGTDSTLAININNGFPKAFIPPQHKAYFHNGDVVGNPVFPSMDSIRKWNNAHLEFTDTSSGGGGTLTIGNPIIGGSINGILYEDAAGTLAQNTNVTITPGGVIVSSNGVSAGTINTSPTSLGFYGTTPITKPSGDIATALSNLGLITSPTLASVTSITASAPLTGGVITTSGSIGLDQMATYTWSGVHTFTNTLGNTIRCDGIAANQQAGITFVNSVTATSGVPNQIAEGLKFLQQTYNNSTSSTTGIWIQPSSTRVSSNVRPRLDMSYTIDGVGWSKMLSFFRTSSSSQTVIIDSLFQVLVNPTTGNSTVTNQGDLKLANYGSTSPLFVMYAGDAGGQISITTPATGMATYAVTVPPTQGTIYTVMSNSDGAGTMLWKPMGSMAHTIFTPTTGSTVTLINNQYNIVNPSGAILALTVTLPSSPANNDFVYIKYAQAVTTVTYAGGTVVDGIVSPAAGGLVVLQYDAGTTSWY